jgi:glycogen debranching enzyme
MAPAQINNRTIHLLSLRDDGSPNLSGERPYMYLPAPTNPAYCIRFEIEGTSSICRNGSLWVNLPGKGEKFDRKNFKEYK